MVGRNIGLSVRGISGEADRYRAQRDRYKLFHPASALRQQSISSDSIPPQQVERMMGAAREAGGRA
jgi:hypothetical protein